MGLFPAQVHVNVQKYNWCVLNHLWPKLCPLFAIFRYLIWLIGLYMPVYRDLPNSFNTLHNIPQCRYIIIYLNSSSLIKNTHHQSRFDARYCMLRAGALGRPRGMVRGGRRKEASGWETRVYLWWMHVDIWQNWRRQWHPTPVLLPGKSHGQRSLLGCNPWGH